MCDEHVHGNYWHRNSSTVIGDVSSDQFNSHDSLASPGQQCQRHYVTFCCFQLPIHVRGKIMMSFLLKLQNKVA